MYTLNTEMDTSDEYKDDRMILKSVNGDSLLAPLSGWREKHKDAS